MAVYLLHFSEPYPNGTPSQHYCGYARNVNHRVKKHMNPHANTASLVRAMHEQGIGFVLARVWPDGDPAFERKLKRSHNLRRYCPVCKVDNKPCTYEIEVGTITSITGYETGIYKECGVVNCKEHIDL